MFRILCTLNENKGTILSRDFLLAYGWGAGNLTKNNVTVAISELRVLLARSSDVKIITAQRQGYLMISKNGDKQK
jgi:DNA-binding winged helix-turn-helix (wHTH) protein